MRPMALLLAGALLLSTRAATAQSSPQELPPPGPPPAPLRYAGPPLPTSPTNANRSSPGMMTGGIVLLALGGVAIGAGAALEGVHSGGRSDDGAAALHGIGGLTIALGVLLAFIGAPLCAYGASAPPPPEAAPSVSQRARPVVSVDRGSLSLRWSF